MDLWPSPSIKKKKNLFVPFTDVISTDGSLEKPFSPGTAHIIVFLLLFIPAVLAHKKKRDLQFANTRCPKPPALSDLAQNSDDFNHFSLQVPFTPTISGALTDLRQLFPVGLGGRIALCVQGLPFIQ